uniref:C-type lectin domain-containing protein n=1 Tax=Steinernema glaseri TaxID=37863 RepID=A0A1I7ZRM3_9BILA
MTNCAPCFVAVSPTSYFRAWTISMAQNCAPLLAPNKIPPLCLFQSYFNAGQQNQFGAEGSPVWPVGIPTHAQVALERCRRSGGVTLSKDS